MNSVLLSDLLHENLNLVLWKMHLQERQLWSDIVLIRTVGIWVQNFKQMYEIMTLQQSNLGQCRRTMPTLLYFPLIHRFMYSWACTIFGCRSTGLDVPNHRPNYYVYYYCDPIQ